MFRTRGLIGLTCGLLVMGSALAAAPAGAPAGSTGICKDGSYYNGETKKGACRGHQGVQDWWGGSAAAPAAAAGATATTAPVAPAVAAKPMPAPAATAAPGGGSGKVWANDSTKVYHCPSDKWYGKTKQGEYMTEADAKAKGFHADHGKACRS